MTVNKQLIIQPKVGKSHLAKFVKNLEEDRLRELVDEGVIGGLAPTALGCMGGIYSVRRAVEELAPVIVDEVLAMRDAGQADMVLLVPV